MNRIGAGTNGDIAILGVENQGGIMKRIKGRNIKGNVAIQVYCFIWITLGGFTRYV